LTITIFIIAELKKESQDLIFLKLIN